MCRVVTTILHGKRVFNYVGNNLSRSLSRNHISSVYLNPLHAICETLSDFQFPELPIEAFKATVIYVVSSN